MKLSFEETPLPSKKGVLNISNVYIYSQHLLLDGLLAIMFLIICGSVCSPQFPSGYTDNE